MSDVKFTDEQANFVVNFAVEMFLRGVNTATNEIQSLKDNIIVNIENTRQKIATEVSNRINLMIDRPIPEPVPPITNNETPDITLEQNNG